MAIEYLDNGVIRLGVDPAWGSAVVYLSRKDQVANVIDDVEAGRLLQQAFYGGFGGPGGGVPYIIYNWHPDASEDGTYWWNPTQAGDITNYGARTLAFSRDALSLYARTEPVDFMYHAAPIPECRMQEWISLSGEIVTCHFRMTWLGDVPIIPDPYFLETVGYGPHEVPAVYCKTQYNRCVRYEGNAPWAGDPNLTTTVMTGENVFSPFDATEQWSALVNASGYGLGMYFPAPPGEVRGSWVSFTGSNCMYMAPRHSRTFAPHSSYDYIVYFTLGTVAEIRSRFEALHAEGVSGGLRYVAGSDPFPPVTTCSLPSGTYPRGVTLTLSATDESGIQSTEYRVNGGAIQPYTGEIFAPEGLFEFRSTDTLSNVEDWQSVEFVLSDAADLAGNPLTSHDLAGNPITFTPLL